ncbi:hypothetical protein SteCoe_10491 [Stentor coeruleus]|uniref:RanBP2-type domain-containing protein n=1 Tax=Stentor coeruleus TaxID=5963 RepID=A0A1R2CFM7_9CILI|nr:hypothetical protein SteCoe_10491 [Stentor coeruleus]
MYSDINQFIEDMKGVKTYFFRNEVKKEFPQFCKSFSELKSLLREAYMVEFQYIKATYDVKDGIVKQITTENDFFEAITWADAEAFRLNIEFDESKVIKPQIVEQKPPQDSSVPAAKPWRCGRCQATNSDNVMKCKICSFQRRV